MPNNLKENNILLVGSGYMAGEYLHVLRKLNKEVTVVGRGERSANNFSKDFGIPVYKGGVDLFLKQVSGNDIPEQAIVASSIESLKDNAISLIEKGVKKILLEKPAGLYLDDIQTLQKLAAKYNCAVSIAYNRRFYKSVETLREKTQEDGGIVSLHFEFTEWVHILKDLNYSKEMLSHLLLVNSSHVIDLVLFLIGIPKEICAITKDSFPWHPSAGIFCGAGVSKKLIPFTYHSNWKSAGRWSVEIMTQRGRYYLKPLEALSFQANGTLNIENVTIDNTDDLAFKPGLLKMLNAFLFDSDHKVDLCSIEEHLKNFKIYEKMAGYCKV